MRQIVLDTETTGLSPQQGHRIIEIGCIEIVNRRVTGKKFHTYCRPERAVDKEAVRVHGLTNAFLSDKPLFKEIVAEFLAFIDEATLIIHNAPFDVGFLDAELLAIKNQQLPSIDAHYNVIDTLQMARKKYPGQKNSLDALCKRLHVDNTHRKLHGALLDAQILAHVYLSMTGGQTHLPLSANDTNIDHKQNSSTLSFKLQAPKQPLPIIVAQPQELQEHQSYLAMLQNPLAWD